MSWDEIDTEKARKYAWRLELTDEPNEESAEAEEIPRKEDEKPEEAAAAPAVTDEERATRRAEIRARANALAGAIERVWNSALPAAQQARQVEALLTSAAEFNLRMVAMSSEPLAPVHLARLANRHWHRLSAPARQNAYGAFMWLEFEPAPTVDLLVEICRDGNEELAGALSLPLFHGLRRDQSQSPFLATGLAARLIALLETADSLMQPWASRLIGLDLLQLSPSPAAIPLLRQYLRLPHLEVRGRALAILLHDYTPTALQPEDVLFMLEDLLVHPPGSGQSPGRFEASYNYSVLLRTAIKELRPAGGAKILEELAFEGRDRHLRLTHDGHWEGKWALVTLSTVYPERALGHIDRCMRNCSSHARFVAVEAAAELPAEPARPRLIALAADGDPEVAELARDRFIGRFATACPVTPLAGFPTELLTDPPSERLYGRLLCLRGPSKEARQAMVEVLLAEAPCREALALITFALCDDDLLNAAGRLPKDRPQMCVRLYRRFGEPAIAALCWLAERYPKRGFGDWLHEINTLVKESKVRKRDLAPLRSLATRWLEDPAQKKQAFEVLAMVGAPVELKERLLDLACRDEPSQYLVGEVLRKWPKDAELDARILKEAHLAWARRALSRMSGWLALGFGRRIRPFDGLAREILLAWQQYAAEQRAKGGLLLKKDAEFPFGLPLQCVHHLHERKKLATAVLQTWLATPAAPEFLLVTRLLPAEDDATTKALLVALNSPTTPHESAQEAAITLIFRKVVDEDDPRLRKLVDGDAGLLRAWLINHIAYGDCKKRQAHRMTAAALLKTATVTDARDLRGTLSLLAKSVGMETVKKALAEHPNRELGERMWAIIVHEKEKPEYWQDKPKSLR